MFSTRGFAKTDYSDTLLVQRGSVREGRLTRLGEMMSSTLAPADEAPVKHLHLKERSSIPSVLRGADAFTITRMESSDGLAERITKISSVPALLVAVSIKSLAIADCQFWVDDKPVPTPTFHRSGPT